MRAEQTCTEIRKEGYCVRVLVDNGTLMICSVDFLKVAGYKCPHERIGRIFRSSEHPGVKKKLAYPVFTRKGKKLTQMCFFDKKAAEAALEIAPCSEDARRWLEKEVLSYQYTSDEGPIEISADISQEPVNDSVKYEEINRIIDRALIELVELKKRIMAS